MRWGGTFKCKISRTTPARFYCSLGSSFFSRQSSSLKPLSRGGYLDLALIACAAAAALFGSVLNGGIAIAQALFVGGMVSGGAGHISSGRRSPQARGTAVGASSSTRLSPARTVLEIFRKYIELFRPAFLTSGASGGMQHPYPWARRGLDQKGYGLCKRRTMRRSELIQSSTGR